MYTDIFQPGHEYTKANVKFCIAVSQTEPIKKLQAFAEQNQQTQGKFTIGDEKVGTNWILSFSVKADSFIAPQCVHACPCKFYTLYSSIYWCSFHIFRTPRSRRLLARPIQWM
jgi:hypothetical protein